MLVYSPRLSEKNSEIVRRMSWGFKIPMTKVLANLIELGVIFIDKRELNFYPSLFGKDVSRNLAKPISYR